MITSMECDGCTTFQGFRLELAPFPVMVSPNGVGTSKRCDALQRLSRLATFDPRTACQERRREAGERFTTFATGMRVARMRLAVELVPDGTMPDELGGDLVRYLEHCGAAGTSGTVIDRTGWLDRVTLVALGPRWAALTALPPAQAAVCTRAKPLGRAIG